MASATMVAGIMVAGIAAVGMVAAGITVVGMVAAGITVVGMVVGGAVVTAMVAHADGFLVPMAGIGSGVAGKANKLLKTNRLLHRIVP